MIKSLQPPGSAMPKHFQQKVELHFTGQKHLEGALPPSHVHKMTVKPWQQGHVVWEESGCHLMRMLVLVLADSSVTLSIYLAM